VAPSWSSNGFWVRVTPPQNYYVSFVEFYIDPNFTIPSTVKFKAYGYGNGNDTQYTIVGGWNRIYLTSSTTVANNYPYYAFGIFDNSNSMTSIRTFIFYENNLPYLAMNYTLTPTPPTYSNSSVFVGSTSGQTGNTNATGTSALFQDVLSCAINKTNGNLYISDLGNQTIRMSTPSGVVSTISISTGLWNPQGLYVDNGGTNLYIADTNNYRIVRYNISSNTSSQFSTGWDYVNFVYINDSGVMYANELQQGAVYTVNTSTGVRTGLVGGLNYPAGMVSDSSGNLYICQYWSHCISKFTPGVGLSLFAGSASSQNGFTDGTGSNARFNRPNDIKVDSYGNFYVCDTGNEAIRKITPDGVVTTITSGGVINLPIGLSFDSSNNMYVANRGNINIIKIS